MVEKTCSRIVFHSEEAEDNLRRIEVIGIPLERTNGGFRRTSSANIYNFFEMFVATELFKENRLLSQYSFELVKLWVYRADSLTDEQSDLFPSQDSFAFQMASEVEGSELKSISVVDVGLLGNQKVLWERGCKELLTPLFQRFVPPAEPPDVLNDYLQMRFGKRLASKLNLYLHMRQNMCFDSLIVEPR